MLIIDIYIFIDYIANILISRIYSRLAIINYKNKRYI